MQQYVCWAQTCIGCSRRRLLATAAWLWATRAISLGLLERWPMWPMWAASPVYPHSRHSPIETGRRHQQPSRLACWQSHVISEGLKKTHLKGLYESLSSNRSTQHPQFLWSDGPVLRQPVPWGLHSQASSCFELQSQEPRASTCGTSETNPSSPGYSDCHFSWPGFKMQRHLENGSLPTHYFANSMSSHTGEHRERCSSSDTASWEIHYRWRFLMGDVPLSWLILKAWQHPTFCLYSSRHKNAARIACWFYITCLNMSLRFTMIYHLHPFSIIES